MGMGVLSVQNSSSVRVTLSKISFSLQGMLCAEKNFSSKTALQHLQFTVFSTVPTAHEAHQTSHIAGFSGVSRGRLYFIFLNIISFFVLKITFIQNWTSSDTECSEHHSLIQ
jgi:hypothetical protein